MLSITQNKNTFIHKFVLLFFKVYKSINIAQNLPAISEIGAGTMLCDTSMSEGTGFLNTRVNLLMVRRGYFVRFRGSMWRCAGF